MTLLLNDSTILYDGSEIGLVDLVHPSGQVMAMKFRGAYGVVIWNTFNSGATPPTYIQMRAVKLGSPTTSGATHTETSGGFFTPTPGVTQTYGHEVEFIAPYRFVVSWWRANGGSGYKAGYLATYSINPTTLAITAENTVDWTTLAVLDSGYSTSVVLPVTGHDNYFIIGYYNLGGGGLARWRICQANSTTGVMTILEEQVASSTAYSLFPSQIVETLPGVFLFASNNRVCSIAFNVLADSFVEGDAQTNAAWYFPNCDIVIKNSVLTGTAYLPYWKTVAGLARVTVNALDYSIAVTPDVWSITTPAAPHPMWDWSDLPSGGLFFNGSDAVTLVANMHVASTQNIPYIYKGDPAGVMTAQSLQAMEYYWNDSNETIMSAAIGLTDDHIVISGSTDAFDGYTYTLAQPSEAIYLTTLVPPVISSHYNQALMDSAGNMIPGATIRVIDPTTGLSITDEIYSDVARAAPLTNPFITDDGVIDFYIKYPRRVRIGIVRPGSTTEYFVEDTDVQGPLPGSQITPPWSGNDDVILYDGTGVSTDPLDAHGLFMAMPSRGDYGDLAVAVWQTSAPNEAPLLRSQMRAFRPSDHAMGAIFQDNSGPSIAVSGAVKSCFASHARFISANRFVVSWYQSSSATFGYWQKGSLSVYEVDPVTLAITRLSNLDMTTFSSPGSTQGYYYNVVKTLSERDNVFVLQYEHSTPGTMRYRVCTVDATTGVITVGPERGPMANATLDGAIQVNNGVFICPSFGNLSTFTVDVTAATIVQNQHITSPGQWSFPLLPGLEIERYAPNMVLVPVDDSTPLTGIYHPLALVYVDPSTLTPNVSIFPENQEIAFPSYTGGTFPLGYLGPRGVSLSGVMGAWCPSNYPGDLTGSANVAYSASSISVPVDSFNLTTLPSWLGGINYDFALGATPVIPNPTAMAIVGRTKAATPTAPANALFLSTIVRSHFMRPHFNRAIVDTEGNLIPGCEVRIIDPADGVSNIPDLLYLDDSTTTEMNNPYITGDGVINFYLATARRVRIGITRPEPGSTEFYIEDMDVQAPPSAGPV
jgi:hypothetical protein